MARGRVIGFVVVVTALVPAQAILRAQSKPPLAPPPVYLTTIGGPGHAQIYPGGVDVGPDGVVYVADTGNDQIVAFNPDGTVKWTRGARQAKALGTFDNPRDVAYLAGRLYVADLGYKRVQVLDAARGTPIRAWPAVLASPIGISAGVDQFGSPVILVTQDTRDRVGVYTPSGAFLRNIGVPTTSDRDGGDATGGDGPGQLSAPRDAATDSSGNVYVADYGNDRIAKFAPDGTWIKNWGGPGGKDGKFRKPYGVAVDAKNWIYVADSTNHRVQIFDSGGTFLAKYGTPAQLSQLRRVAVAPGVPNPDIYLADLWGYKVDRVSQAAFSFTYRQTYGGAAPPDGLFNEPSGVVVDASHVYVADSVNQRMQRFDTATGSRQLDWGERGWGGDLVGFNWPRDLTLNTATGTIWVADTKNGRFVEFTPDGAATGRAFGSLGFGSGAFNRPYAVVSYGSSLIVADSNNDRVQRWDVAPQTPALVWSTRGIGNPQALAVDGSTVLVTDTESNRLLRLSAATGARVGGYLGAHVLHSPEGVAVDAAGDIWVADRALNRLVELTRRGSFLQAFGKRGGGHGEFNTPGHLTIFGGRLYVCDVWNDRVQVFALRERRAR